MSSTIQKMMLANDPTRRSWVESANRALTDFPIQNLPFGVFSPRESTIRRVGVAIGEYVIDLAALAQAGLLAQDAGVFARPRLNEFIALGHRAWRDVRLALSGLLDAGNERLHFDTALRERAFFLQADVDLHLPVEIPGYTDFYSSREHATNVGTMYRDPRNPLLPNWLEIPIGYNGRASSVVVSGTPVRRPNGQIKPPDSDRPVLAACRKLDIELETGFIVGAGNALGEPIACADAEQHIFGMVLLNDWSARDIQQWEYVPLGPFNGKGFATTISPWVVTLAALEPFRCTQPQQVPEPLAYLRQQGPHAFDIHLEVDLLAAKEARPDTIARTNFKHMYWTMAQQLAHHTVSGCNTRVGDLMGSGTISGPAAGSCGSLLESTWNGQRPLTLASGAQRTFIEDGDTLTLRGWCEGDGYRVGFGSCAGTVLPAHRCEE